MEDGASLDRYLDRARQRGAADARVVPSASVVTAAWVRLKCQYGCGGYGASLCCPPHSPTPEQTRLVLDCYRRAILVHRKTQEGLTALMAALEREALLDGFYRAFALGAGPCTLCRDCTLDRCSHPSDARPAMEACGIDVYATARANGFAIEVVRDHAADQNYFGLLLVD
jgi:predicted metal-binding protein